MGIVVMIGAMLAGISFLAVMVMIVAIDIAMMMCIITVIAITVQIGVLMKRVLSSCLRSMCSGKFSIGMVRAVEVGIAMMWSLESRVWRMSIAAAKGPIVVIAVKVSVVAGVRGIVVSIGDQRVHSTVLIGMVVTHLVVAVISAA